MASLDDSLQSLEFSLLQRQLTKGHFSPSPQLSPGKQLSCSPLRSPPNPRRPPPKPLPNAARLKLAAAKSWPEMGTIMAGSSPHAHVGLTRAATFAGFGNEGVGGDTQPLPSQVYRDYAAFRQANGTLESQVELGKDAGDDGKADEEAATQIDTTPAKEGMVDFAGMWRSQTQRSLPENIPTVDIHSTSDVSPEGPSSVNHHSYLRTPGYAGRKRCRNGETISPTTASKTPGSVLGNVLAGKTGPTLMTATQMFANTQAMTSPAGELTRSDPVDTKPSPDFRPRTATSPIVHAMSSPSRADPPPVSRLHVGPRDFYRPADQSQERLEALARLNRDRHAPTSSKVVFDDDDDDDEDDSQVSVDDEDRSRRLGRNPFMATTRTPRRLDTKMNRSKSAVLPVTKTITRHNSTRRASVELIHIEDDGDESSGPDDVDGEDESLGEIITSQHEPDPQDRTAHGLSDSVGTATEVAGSPEPVELPSKHVSMEDEPRQPNVRVDSSQDGVKASGNGIVGDSQVINSTQPPPRPVEPSSISSFVPGSQYPQASSQFQAIMGDCASLSKLSSLPKPPFSSKSEGAVNIPSSPPPVIDDPGTLHDAAQDPGLVSDRPGSQDRSSPADVVDGHDKSGNRPPPTNAVEEFRPETARRPDVVASKSDSTTKTGMFDTAATHLSASQSRSVRSSQTRRMISESPRKQPPGRKLADIANEPTPPNSCGDLDLAAAGLDIINKDDEDFLRSIKSPAKARRDKITYRKKGSLKRKSAVADKSTIPETVREEPVVEKVDERSPRVENEPSHSKRSFVTPLDDAVKPARKRRRAQEQVHDVNARPEQVTVITDHGDVEGQPDTSVYDKSNDQPVPQPKTGHPVEEIAPPGLSPTDQGLSKRRVLALFKGNLNAYYPATCTGIVTDGNSVKYSVRFDDATETVLEKQHLCAFDLRVNDIVKIDRASMRTRLYIIVGFHDLSDVTKTDVAPDSNGHHFVQVVPKSSRKSGGADNAEVEPQTIPVSQVYVNQTMWTKFRDRLYTHTDQKEGILVGTPTVPIAAPGTPPSRSRRQTLHHGQIPTPVATGPLRPPSSCILANMAFAVSSSSSNEADRDHTAAKILAAGGIVLSSGLHELFDVTFHDPDLETTVTTSSPSPSSPPAFRLKTQYQTLTFAAVIADTHSRTQKYIQALALGLPTLHRRWLHASLHSSRPVPWGPYLLPAGDSNVLNAVRSRTLTLYDPTSAELGSRVEKRARLLDGGGVLLLSAGGAPSGGKRKAKTAGGGDKRDVYAFLSLALGAERVRKVETVGRVREVLDRESGWRWVHTPGDLGGLVRALKGEAGHGEDNGGGGGGSVVAAEKGRKRKRTSNGGGGGGGDEGAGRGEGLSVLTDGGVRVVGDEFVIQSLILGELVDE